MSSKINYGLLSLLGVLAAVLLVFMATWNSKNATASAFPGQTAMIATTSAVVAAGGSSTSLIATSSLSGCASRIISTGSSTVMLTFSDYAGQTPTATFGHFQAASTTVAYDSGLYGCGFVKAFSFANQTITISESR